MHRHVRALATSVWTSVFWVVLNPLFRSVCVDVRSIKDYSSLKKIEGYNLVLGFVAGFISILQIFGLISFIYVDYNQCASNMADIKNLVVSNIIPLASKIIEHKLNEPNYYDWRRKILFEKY